MSKKCTDSTSGWEQHTNWLLKLLDLSYDDDELQKISGECAKLAHAMVKSLGYNPETIIGLRKLLEARDCFVRSKLV